VKTLITILTTIVWGLSVQGQITLEATYPNAAGQGNNQFGIVNLGHNDYKYLFLQATSHIFKLYDLNHSLYMTVNIPVVSSGIFPVQHLSRSLFDCDSANIEYIMNCDLPPHVYVYRTDGTLLFEADSVHGYFVLSNSGGFDKQYITSTPSGTKMELDHMDGSVRVYSLCGTLPTSITDNDFEAMENKLLAAPNPSITFTKLFYQLPRGIEEGVILIYDTNGQIVKQYKIDRTFEYLNLSTIDMSAGTYYYSLQTNSRIIETKKLLVIK
jgi:hypothetical protein